MMHAPSAPAERARPAHAGAIPDWLLRQYRNGRTHLLLLGGSAAQRAGVARTFWSLGPLANAPLWWVDCARQQALLCSALEGWLTGGRDAGPWAPLVDLDRGTLYLDAIDRLSPAAQRLLLLFVQRSHGAAGESWAGRLICGAPERVLASVARHRFSESLFDALDKLRFELRAGPQRGAA